MIEKNGKDFVPDENEEWYPYVNKYGVTYGVSGEDLVEYWASYQENQEVKKEFIRELKMLEPGVADKLIMKKTYDSFGNEMDDLYEDETYTVKIK